MVKKLMNISGAQVLGKEELKNVKGGDWRYVCGDGSEGWGSVDEEAELSLDIGLIMCEGRGGLSYLYTRN